MAKRTPPPNLEIVFSGTEIFPESIPLRSLTEALRSIQAIASPAAETPRDRLALHLVRIRRGSAKFSCVADDANVLRQNLRLTGKWLEAANPDDMAVDALDSVEKLSAIARQLNCEITLRDPSDKGGVLATITRDTYRNLTADAFIVGETTISGLVKRVGGATRRRCALRIPEQPKLLYCTVATDELVRSLGALLYQRVVVQGQGTWVRPSWALMKFKVERVHHAKGTKSQATIDALRLAGGDAWDDIESPTEFLREASGE